MMKRYCESTLLRDWRLVSFDVNDYQETGLDLSVQGARIAFAPFPVKKPILGMRLWLFYFSKEYIDLVILNKYIC